MQKLEDFEPVEHLDDDASDLTYESKDDSEMDNNQVDSYNEYAEAELQSDHFDIPRGDDIGKTGVIVNNNDPPHNNTEVASEHGSHEDADNQSSYNSNTDQLSNQECEE